MKTYRILYIHGMGGGKDSRIPAFLSEHLDNCLPQGSDCHIETIVRTYDIDPDIAWEQISSWFKEIAPDLVIGESLGSLHAARLTGVPHLFVSPAFGAATWMSIASYIPGAAKLMRHIFKPKTGERQVLEFTSRILSHYRGLRKIVIDCSPSHGGKDLFYAFFGTDDSYRRSGVVSIRSWRKYFGSDTYYIYRGTHFMEEEYLYTMLMPKIIAVLGLSVKASVLS